jgi:alpha-D-ribose 1-methylphosphonate 5-triphosphate synthase subunit PhnL
MEPILRIEALAKSFTLHNQGGEVLDVLKGVDLDLHPGDCVALDGKSGTGKSTLLRCIYGNYKTSSGRIRVAHQGDTVDIATAAPRRILEVRRHTIGYVTQFLHVIPRIPALDLVAEPMRERGISPEAARAEAARLLERLGVPRRLWPLAPATFSGGEQQRINIARGFAVAYPILLIDEPTASLDGENRRAVHGLIGEALRRGTAIIGIFHDADLRDRVATRLYRMGEAKAA